MYVQNLGACFNPELLLFALALFACWTHKTHCSKPEDLSQCTAAATLETTTEYKPFHDRHMLAQVSAWAVCHRLPGAHSLWDHKGTPQNFLYYLNNLNQSQVLHN